jgi:hypothetical protein
VKEPSPIRFSEVKEEARLPYQRMRRQRRSWRQHSAGEAVHVLKGETAAATYAEDSMILEWEEARIWRAIWRALPKTQKKAVAKVIFEKKSRVALSNTMLL